jgi:thiol-disulfide isomerase/thioredoxin
MKHLIVFFALAVVAVGSLNAQVTRRVLEEEFTNTGCPPCAATDPLVEEFENANMDGICVLKYHTQGPDPADPFYKANTTDANPRADYYGITGVPTVEIDGKGNIFPNAISLLTDAKDQSLADLPTSPFEITIDQQKTTDSIIATVTIKAVGDVPAENDLHVACVFSERYNRFNGSNGRTYYTFIVRKTLPGINQTTGAISTTTKYPVLTMVKGDTKIFRYGAKIGATWLKDQLASVVFIQSNGSKQVYQSNWTIPSVSGTVSGISDLVMSDNQDPMKITLDNKSSVSQTLSIGFVSEYTSPGWSVGFEGVTNSSLTLNAGEQRTINIKLTTPSPAIGSTIGEIVFSTSEGIRIGGRPVTFFGIDNTGLLIDGGPGSTRLGNLLDNQLNPNGLKGGLMNRDLALTALTDWSQFKTVCIAAGDNVGIQVGTNEWPSLSALLESGGNVLFTGTRTVGIYQSSGNSTYMKNWKDNFHINPTAFTTGSWSELSGVLNDPIGNGISTSLEVGTTYTQSLSGTDNAFESIFLNENEDVVGMKAISGSGKVVYLSYEIESLPTAERNTVSKRIIDWFNGVAAVRTSNDASTLKIINYPNPVSTNTTFNYSVTDNGMVNLSVYDVMGREVSRIVSNEMQDKGSYTADFNASKLAAGSYTYVLTSGTNKVTGTMTVTK